MSIRVDASCADELQDGVVALRLIEATPGSDDQGEVPTFRFAISLLATGDDVGGLNLRVGMNETIQLFRGQVGFTVDPAHRGNGYAARAFRLALRVAAKHGLASLIVTCDPENLASRRSIEAVGGTLIDVVEVPEGTRSYEEGSRQKCRYAVPTQ